MAKKKLNGAGVPMVTGVKPTGSSVLLELLNEDEMLGTSLHLPGGSSVDSKTMDAPQAYVLAVGPSYDEANWGFKVGDRVMFSGQFIPAVNYDKSKRKKGTVEPHSVKAVLVE